VFRTGDPPDNGWPFVCRNRTDNYDMSCHIYTNLVRKQGHFQVNPDTCLVERHVTEGMVLREELQTLAPDPLIWHGNGEFGLIFLSCTRCALRGWYHDKLHFKKTPGGHLTFTCCLC
jgi:hypothetical protein